MGSRVKNLKRRPLCKICGKESAVILFVDGRTRWCCEDCCTTLTIGLFNAGRDIISLAGDKVMIARHKGASAPN